MTAVTRDTAIFPLPRLHHRPPRPAQASWQCRQAAWQFQLTSGVKGWWRLSATGPPMQSSSACSFRSGILEPQSNSSLPTALLIHCRAAMRKLATVLADGAFLPQKPSGAVSLRTAPASRLYHRVVSRLRLSDSDGGRRILSAAGSPKPSSDLCPGLAAAFPSCKAAPASGRCRQMAPSTLLWLCVGIVVAQWQC